MEYSWQLLLCQRVEFDVDEANKEKSILLRIRQIAKELFNISKYEKGLKNWASQYDNANSLEAVPSFCDLGNGIKCKNSIEDKKWIGSRILNNVQGLIGLQNERINTIIFASVVTYNEKQTVEYRFTFCKMKDSIKEHLVKKDKTYELHRLLKNLHEQGIIAIEDIDTFFRAGEVVEAKYAPKTILEKPVQLSEKDERLCVFHTARLYEWWSWFQNSITTQQIEKLLKTHVANKEKVEKKHKKEIRGLEKQTTQLQALLSQAKQENGTLKQQIAELEVQLSKKQLSNAIQTQTKESAARKASPSTSEIDKLQRQYADLEKQFKIQTAELEKTIRICQHYQNKLSRPSKFFDIPCWVNSAFKDKLVILPCAERMLQKDIIAGIDIDILCDAIEYLAEEYRDYRVGTISQDRIPDICSYKYGRAFKIKVANQGTIQHYKGQYVVTYKDKPTELSMHLCYGVNPETAIRIYFFFDDTTNQIIVGALPKHLDSFLTN